jgi:DNA-directed RNA polymerase specialized sigma24 family protein
MIVSKIITEIETSGLLRELCENIRVSSNDIDDLMQEIYLILLEYDRDKLIELYEKKQLKFFMVRIIQNQYNSKTSPFYRKYKKYYKYIDGNFINNENNEDVDDIEES